jgi:hypothetical protein
LGGVDPGAGAILTNSHVNVPNHETASLPVALPAESLPTGSPVGRLTAAGVGGGGRALLGSPGATDPDAQPAGRPSAGESPGSPVNTPTAAPPAQGELPPPDTSWAARAGLVPLDAKAWEQGVHQFFQYLGLTGEGADGDPAWSRWAPWFVVVVTLGLSAELARRLYRPAPALDPAELPRRGLAWRWSNDFSTESPTEPL